MDEQRLTKAESIFRAVADLPPAERKTVLDDRCGSDADLRARVETLLARHDEAATGIAGPDDTPTRIDTGDRPGPGVPSSIGPYRLLHRLGSGGMGEVWKAEQLSPVRRTVALKLIKAGMDSAEVLARFEAERQALALMDHPYIAKVFDAGVTENGRPYFVMEHVPGIPVTDYCDRHLLDTRERLELFQSICEGVQHAHQKAVIHRDIKPSNILVSEVDGRPMPKIIDFGIAKATTRKLTDRTMRTALGQIVGTPAFMSPEQADLGNEDVDTRTDVYSLGVVLYQMLAGTLPFEAEELGRAGLEAILRMLREQDPPRPSSRVATRSEQTTDIARHRRTEPGRLASQLKGDLDWIVLRALEKDRNRRYGSPQELATDIRRHLADQPVLAGPPSVRYRTRKFVKRHRVGVAFATTVLLGIVAALVLVTFQNARIAAARDEALLVTATLREMLASVDPSRSGPDVSVREMLDETAATLGERFEGRPLVEATLRHTVGNTYYSLGNYDLAEQHLRVAVDRRRERLGTEDPGTLEAVTDLAGVYRQQVRYEEAEALARPAWETARRVLGDEHPEALAAASELAIVYVCQNRYGEAEVLQRETLEISRRVLGEEHPETLKTMLRLAITYMGQGRFEEAATVNGEALVIQRRILGDEHPETLSSMNNLAYSYAGMGRHGEAEALYREAVEIQRRILGEEHPRTLRTLGNIAETLGPQGRFEEAIDLLNQTLATAREVLGPMHPATTETIHALVRTHRRHGDLEAAESLLSETLRATREALGAEHPDALQCLFDLANLHLQQRRHEEAQALYGDLLEISLRLFGEGHWLTGGVRYNLACSLALEGRKDEAISRLRDILDGSPGYLDRASILDDPDLESLHGVPELDAIVGELERRDAEADGAGTDGD